TTVTDEGDIVTRRLANSDVKATAEVLASAFADNPAYVWMHPRAATLSPLRRTSKGTASAAGSLPRPSRSASDSLRDSRKLTSRSSRCPWHATFRSGPLDMASDRRTT